VADVALPPAHIRVGVGGVLVREGRVLVNRAVYRERFTLPSGYVDPGERVEEALVREFREETSLEVAVGRLLLVRHRVVSASEGDLYLAFALEHRSGTPAALPPEIAEFREVPLEEALGAPWISELSRIAISVHAGASPGWPRSPWDGGEVPGLGTEVYYAAGTAPIDPATRRFTRS
jgi:8-oxo-dGTP diphosphatase